MEPLLGRNRIAGTDRSRSAGKQADVNQTGVNQTAGN
jgi:hypothetical protein